MHFPTLDSGMESRLQGRIILSFTSYNQLEALLREYIDVGVESNDDEATEVPHRSSPPPRKPRFRLGTGPFLVLKFPAAM